MGSKDDPEWKITPEELVKLLAETRTEEARAQYEAEYQRSLRLIELHKERQALGMIDDEAPSPILDLPEELQREAASNKMCYFLMGIDRPDSKIAEGVRRLSAEDNEKRMENVKQLWREAVAKEGVAGTAREAELFTQFYRAEFPVKDK